MVFSIDSLMLLTLCYVQLNLRDPEREYLLTTDPVDYESAMRKAFTLLSKELLIDDLTEIDTIVYLVMRFEAELIMIQSQEKLIIFGFPDMSKYVKTPAKLHSSYSPVVSFQNSINHGFRPNSF